MKIITSKIYIVINDINTNNKDIDAKTSVNNSISIDETIINNILYFLRLEIIKLINDYKEFRRFSV